MSARLKLLLKTLSVVARVVVVIAVLAVGWFVFQVLKSTKVEPEPVAAAEAVLPVRAIESRAIAMPRVYTGYGTARAMDASEISSEVSARVIERPADMEPGVRVETGDLIVALDTTDFRARVEAARQRLASIDAQLSAIDSDAERVRVQLGLAEEEAEVARRDLERIREAAAGGSGTAADVDQRLAAVRRAERTLEAIRQTLDVLPARREQLNADRSAQMATLRVDEENLARTEIRSPIDGVMQRVDAEVGEYLRTGDPIARVVGMDRIEVPVRFPLSARRAVVDGPGTPVRLASDGAGTQTWEGRLTRVAPEADAASRTITAFVEVDQSDSARASALLAPGQFVVARVEPDDGRLRVVVPRRAVVGDRVMVAEPQPDGGHRARVVPVRVSHYVERSLPAIEPGETQWAVLEPGDAGGLAEGVMLIVSNIDSLIGGEAVQPSIAGEPGVMGAPVADGGGAAGGGRR